jgi:hypothetical protein
MRKRSYVAAFEERYELESDITERYRFSQYAFSISERVTVDGVDVVQVVTVVVQVFDGVAIVVAHV